MKTLFTLIFYLMMTVNVFACNPLIEGVYFIHGLIPNNYYSQEDWCMVEPTVPGAYNIDADQFVCLVNRRNKCFTCSPICNPLFLIIPGLILIKRKVKKGEN